MENKESNITGKIKSVEQQSIDVYKLEILSELKNAKAGQFISILCKNTTLRRPFSISGFEKNSEKESVTTILIKLKGKGTTYLSNLKSGDTVDFIAPLGNGFNIKNKNSLLIGAGIGIAPMLFLKKELEKQNIQNYLISGFKNENEIIEGSNETVIGGSVLDNIEKIIDEKNIEIIYSCGPSIVLQKISEICKKKNIDSQLAMEKVMACSIGVCRGCIIRLLKNNQPTQASVCKDGPVFIGSEIIWD